VTATSVSPEDLGRARELLDWLHGEPMSLDHEAADPLPPLGGFPFLYRSAGVLLSGPTGAGRSSLAQACAYDAAIEGLNVAYLGSEVTLPEFNARAADLASRRGDNGDVGEQLARVRYLNLASVIRRAWKEPIAWAEGAARFDVVILDPLSSVASTAGLDFDRDNAEFVDFYDRIVQPLVSAGTSVVMLDNIGHGEDSKKRAKGVSAKQDRADVTLSCRIRTAPSLSLIITCRKVRSVRAPFGYGDRWMFGRENQRVEKYEGAEEERSSDDFRPTGLMEKVSRYLNAGEANRSSVRDGVHGKNEWVLRALDQLVQEGYVEEIRGGDTRGRTYRSLEPFQESE
jgi:hypothetical protein